MSKESSQWLNTMTLVGFAESRGNAWHYRKEDQGGEPNHYPHAIPVDDVLRRLFNFQVVEAPLYIPDGQGGFAPVGGRKAMVTDDTNDVLGIFSGDAGSGKGYLGHAYDEWLLEGPATLIDTSKGELGIGSAGLLKNRGLAWVSIEMEGVIQTKEGLDFRPHLLAATSFDGSLATTYKRVQQLTVCDNTLDIALGETGQQVKIKHSAYSGLKLGEARAALNIIFEQADAFAAEVSRLAGWKVSTREWDNLLDALVPVPEVSAEPVTKSGRRASTPGRGYTMAVTKRETLNRLYKNDERATPWKGTALGVLQAFNTYYHHESNAPRGGVHRAQRNMLWAVDGTLRTADTQVIDALVDITDNVPAMAGATN